MVRLPRHFGKENLCYGQEQCPIPDFKVLTCGGCPANIEEPKYERWKKPKHLSHAQWDEINQLKARQIALINEVKELRVKKKDEEINIEC